METSESSNVSYKRVKTVYYSTVISIALVCAMIGLLGLIVTQTYTLSKYVKENIVLNVIVNEHAQYASIDSLQHAIGLHPYVKEFKYISKEDAAKSLSEDLGEDFIKFLGYNPLLPTVEIKLKAEYAQNKEITILKDELEQSPVVKEIHYQKNLVSSINDNIRVITLVLLIFVGLLLIISVGLINHSLRLVVYAQRFIIKSMQLIGATKGFIRKPYLFYGLVHGFLGGTIAVMMLSLVIYLMKEQVPEITMLYNYNQIMLIFLGIIVGGIVLAIVSSFFAVNRFLRLKIHELYR